MLLFLHPTYYNLQKVELTNRHGINKFIIFEYCLFYGRPGSLNYILTITGILQYDINKYMIGGHYDGTV